ncbi:MAG: hypothetical protein NT093_04165 [Candidatus Moranbacteria bacterium]|nr:hypothetical protein [Candidatus Moranbacteria bacterium]
MRMLYYSLKQKILFKKGELAVNIGEILAIIGGVITIFGAFDLMDAEKLKEVKVLAIKIGTGLLILGVGLVLKHFGI